MADGLNIPGVSDRYKTNDLVKSLMEVERIPLKREEEKVETFKNQQDAWRGINQKMATLRDSCKSLYSFENPFNNKLTSSSDEAAVTVEAGREAEYGSFKLDVIQPAATDRFLSDEINADQTVPQGKYTYKVGDKTIDFNWRGGKLTDFVTGLNRRGGETVKAGLIGVSAGKKALMIESLKTGAKNRLIFENQAFDFAKSCGMISDSSTDVKEVRYTKDRLYNPENLEEFNTDGLPSITKDGIGIKNGKIIIPPRSGFEMDIPESANRQKGKMEFLITETAVDDLAEKLAQDMVSNSTGSADVEGISDADDTVQSGFIEFPSPGGISFEGISILNNASETSLPPQDSFEEDITAKTKSAQPGEEPEVAEAADVPEEPETPDLPQPLKNAVSSLFYIRDVDGNETQVPAESFSVDAEGNIRASILFSDFPDAQRILVRNTNTGTQIEMSMPSIYSDAQDLGYKPKHAVSEAQDAVIKYEGITMNRASNDIDDVVPHVTLHVHDKTDRTATLKVEPDKESAKDAIITFVGKYNQTLAEINILSQNKPEIISELDYLTSDEEEKARERLGMFQGDNTLTSGRSSLQQTISTMYRAKPDATITLLAQIGVSTNAGGGGRGYSPSQMRGYLEVDEKKLDKAIENDLEQIKNLFGYDSDGDLIIDNGIAFRLDKQLTGWVQTGGVISSRTNSLEGQIKASNQKIARLQTQLDRKEAELKQKYAAMEGTLGNLESQQNSLQNFATQGQKR